MQKLSIILIVLLLWGCKEAYEPNIQSPHTGYLVVEGFINYGTSPTVINLSRTVKLIDTVNFKPENNARVHIEAESGEKIMLTQTSSGVYSAYTNLSENKKYRLTITTSDQNEYVSEYSQVRNTPDIDSISWKQTDKGLQLHVNTHDKNKQTKYYRWKYDETWEIRSAFENSLKYTFDDNGRARVSFLYPDESSDQTIIRCWRNYSSANILIGSSEKLTEDRIYAPVAAIEDGSEKVSVKYSINLKQYAMSAHAYNFYLQMKKNTEQLGTIFDPQPTELKGNIVCITNPGEKVIGYVEVSQEKVKRIFINRAEISNWGYRSGCIETIIDNHPDSIAKYGIGLSPTIPVKVEDNRIFSFGAAPLSCVDCRTRGTNMMPHFWPG